MIGNAQLIVALCAGLAAGLVFFLAGRRMLDHRHPIDPVMEQSPAEAPQPHSRSTQDNLSPEAQAFIKAFQSHNEPPPKASDDPIWAVDIWDTRHAPGVNQGLPH